MIYHNIYNSWSWTGGHADGETDLLAVALREVTEETGLQTLRPVSRELFSVEILTVDGHENEGGMSPPTCISIAPISSKPMIPSRCG